MSNISTIRLLNECSLEDVRLARDQIEYTPFHYALLFRFTCGLIGALLTVDVFKRIRAIYVFHINAQIILLSDILSCLLFDFGLIVSQGVNFILLHFGDPHNPCSSAVSTWFCLFFRSIPQFGLMFTFGCNALFAGERLVSQYYKNRYEFVSPSYAIIGVIAYGAPCMYNFVQTVLATKLDKSVNYCWEVYGPPANWILIGWIVSDVISAIIIALLHHKNLSGSSSISDLSTRFHIKASLDITRLLLPLISIHFVFNIANCIVNVLVQSLKENMPSMQYRTLTLFSNLISLKVIFLPGYLSYLFRKVARQRSRRLKTLLDRSKEEKQYFEAYKNAWN